MNTLFLRLRTFGVPVLVAALLFVAGCSTTGVNRGDLNLVSMQEEWQLGQQLEAQLAKQLKLVNDPVALNYVTQVGKRIIRQTEMANVPWEFHIVADPTVNAFNIPGGHIYVHTGLLAKAENASELAGVMAHEIAHGVSRHATERISKTYGLSFGAGTLLGRNPGAISQIATQLAAGGAIAKVSRSDEREADRLGVRYMHGAGYNPNGMATMFQKLLAERKARPGRVAQFFSTHPLTEDRITNVRQEASNLPRRSSLITNEAGFTKARQSVSRYNR